MFFYLKSGLPIVVPQLPDFMEMVNKYKFGVATDVVSAGSVAGAINLLMGSEQEYVK
jgi:hypothetical protein